MNKKRRKKSTDNMQKGETGKERLVLRVTKNASTLNTPIICRRWTNHRPRPPWTTMMRTRPKWSLPPG